MLKIKAAAVSLVQIAGKIILGLLKAYRHALTTLDNSVPLWIIRLALGVIFACSIKLILEKYPLFSGTQPF